MLIPKYLLLFIFLCLPAYAQRLTAPEALDRTTDTLSSSFTTVKERLEFLDRYLNFPSQPVDAQYHLIYFDNSVGFPPGPSDWDIKVVVWLEPKDTPLWLKNMTKVATFDDFDWVLKLSPESTELDLETAQYFETSGKRAALPKEGVVALWYSSY
jgi:hypothetical protein